MSERKITSARLYPHSENLIEAVDEEGYMFLFWLDASGAPHRVTPVLNSVDGVTIETLVVNDGNRPIQLPLRIRVVKS